MEIDDRSGDIRSSPGVFTREFWTAETSTAPIDALRVVLGSMLVWWYVDLLPDATILYSDQGILPRSAAIGGLLRENRVSLMDAGGSAEFATLFLLAGLLAAFCLAVGFKTRLAAIVNFVLLLSVHERNILHLDGSDTMFRVLSFWIMFAPVGRRFSVDAAVARGAGRPLRPHGPAFVLRLLQFQIALVYLLNFTHKLNGSKWLDGTALYYTLHLQGFLVRQAGTALSNLTPFTEAGTYLTLSIEACFLPFVFFPFLQPYLRTFGLLSALALHAGIGIFMKVGWFPYLMPATYLLFLEPQWIEWIARRLDHAIRKTRLDRAGSLIIGTLAALSPPHVPSPVAPDVAPAPPIPAWAAGLARFCLLVLFLNSIWFSAPRSARNAQPDWCVSIVEHLGLWQTWDMFAPNPLSVEGHLDIRGRLADGTEIDLIRAGYGQGGWNPARPYHDGWYYSRWMKVAERLHTADWQNFRLEYSRAICRRYNATRGPGQPLLDTFTLAWVEREIPPPGQPAPDWREIAIWEHHCLP